MAPRRVRHPLLGCTCGHDQWRRAEYRDHEATALEEGFSKEESVNRHRILSRAYHNERSSKDAQDYAERQLQQVPDQLLESRVVPNQGLQY